MIEPVAASLLAPSSSCRGDYHLNKPVTISVGPSIFRIYYPRKKNLSEVTPHCLLNWMNRPTSVMGEDWLRRTATIICCPAFSGMA